MHPVALVTCALLLVRPALQLRLLHGNTISQNETLVRYVFTFLCNKIRIKPNKKRPASSAKADQNAFILLQQRYTGVLAKRKRLCIPKGALHLSDMCFVE